MLLSRRHPIDRIEHWIERLDRRSSQLLEREGHAAEALRKAQGACADPHGRIAATRARRALGRSQARLERLRTQRRELVEDQIRSIMFALQDESRHTRDELDRQLERLAPVQERWDRLRATFDTLETTIEGPAFTSLADHWKGQLEIPEFPVAQRAGYAKPFPQRALLF